MADKTLHFTLGPVQGFVGQARRTRDLWAGSFLLSYLSGQAMKAVLDAGGRIHLPAVQDDKGEETDPLLRAIMGRNPRHDAEKNPRIGSLLNRFKASVPEGFAPEACAETVQQAWEKVATQVYESYVRPVTSFGHDTEAIWRRQVENFWDIAWVIGDGDGHDWLTMRKNWRTYAPPVEGGDHCTLMGDWQEISGFVRSHERKKQDDFWKAFKGNVSSLDIGEQERLCAISLIKRLFHKRAEETIGWKLSVNNWPSTSYLAAVEWVLNAYDKNPEACDTYLRTVEETVRGGIFGEYRTNLQGLERVGDFGKLDGGFYFVASLENENTTPLPGSEEGDRKKLVEALQELYKKVGEPSSYYALLLMDSDRLGKLLQEGGEEALSGSLLVFTKQVNKIITDNLGVTVYAGGDDVLALLPLGKALDAAEQLEVAYREAFLEKMGEVGRKATISAAVVFAGSRLTLRSVLKEAHHQLDNVAKDENGRNSIAVSVLTGSGRSLSWRSHWRDHNEEGLVTQLMKLATEQAELYSSSFLYGLRENFEVLTDNQGKLILDLKPLKLIASEYMRNRDQGDLKQDRAEELAGRLLNVCRYRQGEQKLDFQDVQNTLQEDGAILVRFLASKGKS